MRIVCRSLKNTAMAIAVLVLLAVSLGVQAAPPPPGDQETICFYAGVDLACVQRAAPPGEQDPAARARVLLQVMLEGPTPTERARAIHSALPDGTRLHSVEAAGCPACELTIRLDVPASFLYGGLDPAASDMIVRQAAATLEALNVRALDIQARDREGNWRPLSYFLFEPPLERKREAASQAPEFQRAQTGGALDGKTVYLSAGHGWYWSRFSDWRTQRFNTGGIVEDFNNAEAVNQYLIQYLRNAGADVWTVREHDMNTGQIIVMRNSPDYADEGDWFTGAGVGYGGINPRYAFVSATATATATWTFTPTTSGRYAVYVWYRDGTDRAPDAHYLVQHAGDTSKTRINQTAHGYTWRYIGTYPFAAGQTARVLLTNQSSASDCRVVADAIRIGGGMGSEPGDTPVGYVSSGRPRWEEASRYWAKYQGAPPSVYDPVQEPCSSYGESDGCDDVTARPRYAEWETSSNPGEDAVYVSWHSNAFDGVMRGTESYIYLTPTPGSEALQSWIHSTLVSDLRAEWDPEWADRGVKRADLGEVRLLSTMPGVLLEVAFHDQPDDVNALKDPRFEQLAARAVYKGIVRYFAEQDGRPAVFSPQAPQALVARNVAPGTVRLDWLASSSGDADLYRVYISSDGFGWKNGVAVDDTTYTLTNLAPGQLIFARVTGVNDGGESFPTPVVGARVGWPAPALIVDGFGRIDRYGLIAQDDGGSLGVNYRLLPDQINSFSYVVQHGAALSLPFDSAHRRALGTLPVALDDYAMVDWIAGEEQSPSSSIPPHAPEIALSADEQIALQNYMADGGALLISGAELGYDLVNNNKGAAFYANALKAAYLGDDAQTYTIAPLTGSIFDGLPSFSFDDGSHGGYDVGFPDYFMPTGGAEPALIYVGGQGNTAALQYDGGGCSRLVYMGFPFETIYGASVRQAVMDRIVTFLAQCQPPDTVIQSPSNASYHRDTPQLTGTASSPPGASIAAVQLQIYFENTFWNGTAWQAEPAWVVANGASAWSYALPEVLADGWYTVTAQAWNTLGAADPTPAQVSFAMDNTPPSAPAPIAPAGGAIAPHVETTFAYSPGHDWSGVAGYVIRVDGQPFTTTPALTFTLPAELAPGKHSWTVRAFDRLGNLSAPGGPAQFAASSEIYYQPDTVIWSPDQGDYNAAPPVWGTAGDETGVAAVRLQIVSGTQYWNGTWLPDPAWLTATGASVWSYTLPLLGNGFYTVTAQAWSVSGLSDTTPAQVGFALDTIAPTAPVPITPTGGITVAGVGVTFVYSPASDAGGIAGYVIEIDAQQSFTTTLTTCRLPFALADGAHTWTVRAFDHAGNLSERGGPADFVAVSEHIYLPIILMNSW